MKQWPLLLVGVFLFYSGARGQGYLVTSDKPFEVLRVVDTAVMGPLERSGELSQLSAREKDYLHWVNLMRKDPSAFYNTYISSYLKQFPEAVSAESRSLALEMKGAKGLPMFRPSRQLYRAASGHAAFLARTKRLSHQGEGGKDFGARMQDVGVRNCAGEVIFEGKDDMLVAVILLLIDHRVPAVGHRKALLNPSFVITGAAVRYSSDGRAVMVQDLSCQ